MALGRCASGCSSLFSRLAKIAFPCRPAAAFEKMKEEFHRQLQGTSREGVQRQVSSLHYNHGDPLLHIKSLIDKVDIHHLHVLSECIKSSYPGQWQDRRFDAVPVRYSGDEVVLEGGQDAGGNDVIYMEGYLQQLMPQFVDHILNELSRAASDVGWFPYPKQLGVRCVESLLYFPGGELSLHTDSESVFTIVIMLSDPAVAFAGGDFMIQKDRCPTLGIQTLRVACNLGDAVMFDSNALHGVDSIQTGERKVLVLELWPYEDALPGDKRPSAAKFKHRVKIPSFLMTARQRV